MDTDWNRLIEAVERVANANEKLLSIAEEEQMTMEEPGPPVCPHCGKLDPVVTEIGDAGGTGRLSEFIVAGETHCCNKRIYAIPLGFDTTTTPEMAEDILKIKKGGNA